MNPSKKVLLIGWDAADWKVINPLMDAGKMPNVQKLVEQGSMAHIATLAPAAFADALDIDRHRKAAVQARDPRVLRANAGRAGHSAGDQPLAAVQGGLEHFQPERHQEHRHRLVAEPPGRADQRGHGVGPLPSLAGECQDKLAGHSGDDPPSGTHRDPGRAQAAPRGDRRRDARPVRAQSAARSIKPRIPGSWDWPRPSPNASASTRPRPG